MLVRLCSKSFRGFPGGGSSKEPTCLCRKHKRCRFNPWVEKIPWRRKWQCTPVLLPGKLHGQRSLEGYSPCGHKKSDTTGIYWTKVNSAQNKLGNLGVDKLFWCHVHYGYKICIYSKNERKEKNHVLWFDLYLNYSNCYTVSGL